MTPPVFDVEAALRAWPRVTPSFVESLGRFFNGGIVPGGFLTACLKGDLADAVRRADPFSLAMLRDIVGLLDDQAPAIGWGSEAAFHGWLERIREERAQARAQDEKS